jgi:ribonuclease E
MVRSTASIALHVLRVLEDALIKSAAHNITVRTRPEVALYILNQKRANLSELEQRFGVSVTIVADDSLTGTSYHAMERGEPATGVIDALVRPETPRLIEAPELAEEEVFAEDTDEDEDAETETEANGEESEQGDGRRRRRRRRRRGRDREATGIAANAPQPSDDALAVVAQIGNFPDRHAEDGRAEAGDAEERNGLSGDNGGMSGQKRDGKRRRSRRRGRGPNDTTPEIAATDWPADAEAEHFADNLEPEAAAEFRENIVAGLAPHGPGHAATVALALHGAPDEPQRDSAEAAYVKPREEPIASSPSNAPALADVDPNRPKRTGWWQRAKASMGG